MGAGLTEDDLDALLLPTGSRVAQTPEEAAQITDGINGPVVLKSQVLTGGRMKAGGVLFAETPTEASHAAKKILDLTINGTSADDTSTQAVSPASTAGDAVLSIGGFLGPSMW